MAKKKQKKKINKQRFSVVIGRNDPLPSGARILNEWNLNEASDYYGTNNLRCVVYMMED